MGNQFSVGMQGSVCILQGRHFDAGAHKKHTEVEARWDGGFSVLAGWVHSARQ